MPLKSSPGWSKAIRIIMVILTVEFSIVGIMKEDNASILGLIRFFSCFTVCSIFILLYSYFKDKVTNCLIVGLALWTLYETVTGLLQNSGMIDSNHSLFSITGSFRNPNPYAGFLAVSLGILLSFVQGKAGVAKGIKRLAVLAIALIVVILPSTKCRSAYVAVMVIIGLLIWKQDGCRKFLTSWATLIIPLMMISVLVLYLWKKPSADWRMFQARISCRAMKDNLLFGSGLGHYGMAATKTQFSFFQDRLVLNDGEIQMPAYIDSDCKRAAWLETAFCDPLQIGVEAGLVSMVTYLILVTLTLLQLYNKRSVLFYGALALHIISLFSYPLMLWQNELLLAAMTGEAGAYESGKDVRWRPMIAVLLISVTAIICFYPTYRRVISDKKEWQSDRYFYNIGEYGLYSDYCSDKLNSQNCNSEFLLEYGVALGKTGKIGLSDSILSIGFGTTGNPAFLISLGDNRACESDYDRAEEYYWNAFCCIPDRLLPLKRIADIYSKQGKTYSLSRLQLFVRNYHPKIESDLTKRLRAEIEEL